MKASTWRVDPSGEFRFSDATDPRQLVFFTGEPDFQILQRQVPERFRGQETPVRDIEEFVVSETAFRETHYKKTSSQTAGNLPSSRPRTYQSSGSKEARNLPRPVPESAIHLESELRMRKLRTDGLNHDIYSTGFVAAGPPGRTICSSSRSCRMPLLVSLATRAGSHILRRSL